MSAQCHYCGKTLSTLRADGMLPAHRARGGPCAGSGARPSATAEQIIHEARARVRESRLGVTGAEVEKRARKGRDQ